MTKKEPDTGQSQLDKFKQAACELECDDDERHFAARVGKLAKARPELKPTKSD